MFRVLDYSHTGFRLFRNFYDLDTSFKESYDIIITQRDHFQNDINDITGLLNDNGTIIIDITSESGCIDDFFVNYFNRIIENNPNTKFVLLSEFDSPHRLSFDNVKVLIDNRLLESIFCPLYKTDSSWNEIPDSVFIKQNKILTLNGSVRVHRILFLLSLYKNNLLDKLNCSFRFYDHSDVDSFQENSFDSMVVELKQNDKITDDDVSLLNELKNRIPIEIDKYNLTPSQNSMSVFDSVMNIVVENVYGYFCCDKKNPSITVTEKTLKPFMTHNIPIFVGLPGTVSFVRSMGYDVFDDLVDHSYDNEVDELKRMDMIIDEIKKFVDFDLVSFYNQNKYRFIRNKENVYYRTIGGYTLLRDFLKQNNLL